MVNGIGTVVEVRQNSIITETGREFELPFDLTGITADSINEWLGYLIALLKDREDA
jgi:hypothetical protein